MITTAESKICNTFFETFSKAYIRRKSFEIGNMRTFVVKLTINIVLGVPTRWLFFSWFPFSHSTSYCICCSVESVRQSTNITHRARDQSIMAEAKSFRGFMDILDSKLLNEVLPFSNIYTSSHKK